MTFPNFILAEPLAFHAASLAAYLHRYDALFEKARAAQSMGTEPHQLSIADFVNQRRPYAVSPDGIATIHVNDVLSRNTTGIDRLLGATDYNALIDEFDLAAADPKVRAVLLDINSPGGSAIGAPEASAAVAACAAQKPVVSYIEYVGASAAFHLASPSTAIVVSQSAITGSIGTIMTFLDFAGMAAQFGITPHIITPAKSDLKAAGNRFRTPTAAESKWTQERIESLNANFLAHVSQYRPAAGAETMRGQWFTGSEAVANGLADQVGNRAAAITAALALTA